jgi:hypothetical protein
VHVSPLSVSWRPAARWPRASCLAVALLLPLTSLWADGPNMRPATGEDTRPTVSQRGFVFVAGQYVAPPYRIEGTEEGVLINGRAVSVPGRDSTAGGAARRPDSARTGGTRTDLFASNHGTKTRGNGGDRIPSLRFQRGRGGR